MGEKKREQKFFHRQSQIVSKKQTPSSEPPEIENKVNGNELIELIELFFRCLYTTFLPH